MRDEKPLFDRTQLHEGAASSIDRAGQALIKMATVRPFQEARREPFPSREKSAGTITDADIIGDITASWTDWSGRTIGRYFAHEGQNVCLIEDGYVSLRRIAEKVEKAEPFTTGLSGNFVEKEVFSWWRNAWRGDNEIPLSHHLLNAAESAVADHMIMVPISAIEVEKPFQFGEVLVTPIDATLFDNFVDGPEEQSPEDIERIRTYGEQLKAEFGHLTGIVVKVVGEPGFARARALEMASQAATIFRFMCPAAVSWNVGFSCFPKGIEHIRRSTDITLEDGKIAGVSTTILDWGMFKWQISSSDLDRYMNTSFWKCAAFLESGTLTEFQQRVRTAIAMYSEAVASFDVSNRLLYAMSALEHLFLRDAKEPLQSSVGDRIAYLIEHDPAKRMQIAANFKDAYGLRSRRVHHLAKVDDETVLKDFFRNAYVAMHIAIGQLTDHKEHKSFLDSIEAIKYGGIPT